MKKTEGLPNCDERDLCSSWGLLSEGKHWRRSEGWLWCVGGDSLRTCCSIHQQHGTPHRCANIILEST